MPYFREMVVRSGFWSGQHWPTHASMRVSLAPLEYPAAVLTFQHMDGSAGLLHISAAQVSTVDASSGGWTFFGFGGGGMVAAGLASAIDSMLAPWDLLVSGPYGQFHLHAYHGPPPLADEWNRVLARLHAQTGSVGDWELDDEDNWGSDGYDDWDLPRKKKKRKKDDREDEMSSESFEALQLFVREAWSLSHQGLGEAQSETDRWDGLSGIALVEDNACDGYLDHFDLTLGDEEAECLVELIGTMRHLPGRLGSPDVVECYREFLTVTADIIADTGADAGALHRELQLADLLSVFPGDAAAQATVRVIGDLVGVFAVPN